MSMGIARSISCRISLVGRHWSPIQGPFKISGLADKSVFCWDPGSSGLLADCDCEGGGAAYRVPSGLWGCRQECLLQGPCSRKTICRVWLGQAGAKLQNPFRMYSLSLVGLPPEVSEVEPRGANADSWAISGSTDRKKVCKSFPKHTDRCDSFLVPWHVALATQTQSQIALQLCSQGYRTLSISVVWTSQ